MDEIVGEAAVERLLRVYLEVVTAMARRGRRPFRAAFEDPVQQATVVGRHVLHVVGLFQPALDLETRDTGLHQLLEMGAVVEVFQAQQMLPLDQHTARLVEQVPRQAARLGAGTPIGAAVADVMAQITLAAVTHTQGAMHKKLQRHGGLLADRPDLFHAEFTAQHHLAEAHRLEELYLFHRQVVALGAGVQGDGQPHLQQGHVLHDEGVDAGVPAVERDLAGRFQLTVVEQGVQSDIDLSVEQGRMAAQPFDVGDGIAGLLAGSEGRAPDIYGIRPMVDGGDAHLRVLGRRK